VLYELLYTGNSGNYVCGQSYTGNWHSPVWSLYEDVYSGYNKKINILYFYVFMSFLIIISKLKICDSK
jgi:hypothetical protein